MSYLDDLKKKRKEEQLQRQQPPQQTNTQPVQQSNTGGSYLDRLKSGNRQKPIQEPVQPTTPPQQTQTQQQPIQKKSFFTRTVGAAAGFLSKTAVNNVKNFGKALNAVFQTGQAGIALGGSTLGGTAGGFIGKGSLYEEYRREGQTSGEAFVSTIQFINKQNRDVVKNVYTNPEENIRPLAEVAARQAINPKSNISEKVGGYGATAVLKFSELFGNVFNLGIPALTEASIQKVGSSTVYPTNRIAGGTLDYSGVDLVKAAKYAEKGTVRVQVPGQKDAYLRIARLSDGSLKVDAFQVKPSPVQQIIGRFGKEPTKYIEGRYKVVGGENMQTTKPAITPVAPRPQAPVYHPVEGGIEHGTDLSNLESILKTGLKPNGEGKVFLAETKNGINLAMDYEKLGIHKEGIRLLIDDEVQGLLNFDDALKSINTSEMILHQDVPADLVRGIVVPQNLYGKAQAIVKASGKNIPIMIEGAAPTAGNEAAAATSTLTKEVLQPTQITPTQLPTTGAGDRTVGVGVIVKGALNTVSKPAVVPDVTDDAMALQSANTSDQLNSVVESNKETFIDVSEDNQPIVQLEVAHLGTDDFALNVQASTNIAGLSEKFTETYPTRLAAIESGVEKLNAFVDQQLATVPPEPVMAQLGTIRQEILKLQDKLDSTEAALTDQFPAAEVFTGKAFRADTGFTHSKGTTAADVVKYEQQTLGNKIDLSKEKQRLLKEIPASRVVWVTKTKQQALRYGDNVSEVNIPPDSVIIARDPDGGFLVLKEAPAKFRADEPVLKGLSSTTIESLRGRDVVSREYVENLLRQKNVPKAEIETIQKTLAKEKGEKIAVKPFAEKVKRNLLKITPEILTGSETRYEGVTLPPEERGVVANYEEHVYQSKVPTSAGRVHFDVRDDDAPILGNYFAHTRVEDILPGWNKEMVGQIATEDELMVTQQRRDLLKPFATTRRIIEIQSDLMQRGRLEQEGTQAKDILRRNVGENNAIKQKDRFGNTEITASEFAKKEATKRLGALDQLQTYEQDWYQRIIKEEIKLAAQSGKTRLLVATGETAMKVEGLGETQRWHIATPDGETSTKALEKGDLKVGAEIRDFGFDASPWVITEVLDGGRFKAVNQNTWDAEKAWKTIKDTYTPPSNQKYLAVNSQTGESLQFPTSKEADAHIAEEIARYHAEAETFDISGKADTENPIYRFYNSEIQRYLKRTRTDFNVFEDEYGNTWFETMLTPRDAREPVTAFGEPVAQKVIKARQVVQLPDETRPAEPPAATVKSDLEKTIDDRIKELEEVCL